MNDPGNPQTTAAPWWQRGVVYQVYPRSFMDSNGDGVGDLPGITSRLDYLRDLGVDAIWISPFYPSPMVDAGYDISDHEAIDPVFGTLEDFDALLAAAHSRGLRVILDLVPCHTSDQHPWFIAARAGRDNPFRDYYLWHDPAPGGGPPNNWISNFGGGAWTFDTASGQYYLHSFAREQPDLNLRSPKVEAAIYDIMRFWLRRGVDGFRIDVINGLLKDPAWRDNPPNPDYVPGTNPYRSQLQIYSRNQEDAHLLIQRMRQVLDEFPDRVMIGEAYLMPEALVRYYGHHLDEAHLPFNFRLISLPWQAAAVAEAVDVYEQALPPAAWPNWVLGNHDRHRIASRVGLPQARVAAMMLLTLRGTPTWYYGDELGMIDVPIPPERVQDPWEKNLPGMGLGRDPERTPMQWDQSAHAGFSQVEPWLPVAEDAAVVNVNVQEQDPRSMLTLCRALLRLRRQWPALCLGSYRRLVPQAPAPAGTVDLFAYERRHGDAVFAVLLNMGPSAHSVDLSAATGQTLGEVVLSTHLDRQGAVELAGLALRPDEGLLIRLSGGL